MKRLKLLFPALCTLGIFALITFAAFSKGSNDNELTRHIIHGSYITNDAGTDHDLEEQFPKEAARIFYEKGWRAIDGHVLSPDDVNKLKRPVSGAGN